MPATISGSLVIRTVKYITHKNTHRKSVCPGKILFKVIHTVSSEEW